jgi:hypothetical protein
MADCSVWENELNTGVLQFTQGSDIEFDITYTDDDDVVVDLTGYTFSVYAGSDPAFSNAELTMADPTTGVVHFYLAHTYTTAFERDAEMWVDISKIDPSGKLVNSGQIPIGIV